jgi:hypothetical protein
MERTCFASSAAPDAFSASLLMPKSLFREAAANVGNGLDAVVALANLVICL